MTSKGGEIPHGPTEENCKSDVVDFKCEYDDVDSDEDNKPPAELIAMKRLKQEKMVSGAERGSGRWERGEMNGREVISIILLLLFKDI